MTKGCVKVFENVNVLHTGNHTHQREKSFTDQSYYLHQIRESTVSTRKQSQNNKIT